MAPANELQWRRFRCDGSGAPGSWRGVNHGRRQSRYPAPERSSSSAPSPAAPVFTQSRT